MRTFDMSAPWCGAVSFLGSVGLLLSTVACGSADSTPPGPAAGDARAESENPAVQSALAETEPSLVLGTETQFLRVDLQRSQDGSVSSSALTPVKLEQLALPSLAPEYLLVAYSGSAVLSAVPVSFPKIASGVGWEDDAMVHSNVAVSDSRASAFLPWLAEMDHVVLYGADGKSVLDINTNELPALPSFDLGGLKSDAFGSHVEPLSGSSLETKYPQIHFAGAGSDSLVPSQILTDGKTVDATDANNKHLEEVLERLTPMLRSSIQTIVWMEWPSNSPSNIWLGVASGSMLVLNAARAGGTRFTETVIHEAAHNFAFLTAASANTEAALQEWPVEARASAAQLVAKFRLASGLEGVFRQLHNTGLKQGLSKPYLSFCGNSAADCLGESGLNLDGIASAGFATKYAACSECEDLAEYVSVTATHSPDSKICNLFNGAKPLAPEASIPYAKLVLLRGVGAISAAAFDDCTHGVQLSQDRGVHFGGGPSFTTDAKAGGISRDEGPSYGVFARGSDTYQVLLEVSLKQKGATPLGLHRLDGIGLWNLGNSGLNGVYLANDNDLNALASAGGLLLFTVASGERTAGAIFGLVLQDAFAIDEASFPFGTFSVP